jgi:hypothetical protein
MAVPYIFASVPAGTTIPLAEIDANFAYLSYSPTMSNLSVTGTLSVGQELISNGPAAFNNGLSFIGTLGVNGSYVSPTGTTGAGNLVLSANPTLVAPNLGQPTYGDLSLCSGYSVHDLTGLGNNVVLFLANPTSSNLNNAVIDSTGVGKLVFNQDPVIIGPILEDPDLGNVVSGNLQNCIGYQGVNISGVVPIARGGTGLSAVGNLNDILQVTTAGTLGYAPVPPTGDVLGGAPSQVLYQVNTNVTGFIPNGTTGQVLQSNGALAPSWQTFNVTSNVAGILPVLNGGTGSNNAQSAINTLVGGVTANSVVKGNGTNIVLAQLNATDISYAGTLINNTTGSAGTFTSTTQNSQFNSIGVNVAPSGTAGNINATGSISDGTGTLHPIIAGTVQTAVGTAVSFTSVIPSWATRITMNFNNVVYAATANNDWAIQLGAGGVYNTNSYNGLGLIYGIRASSSTAGLIIIAGIAANPMTGSIVFNKLTGNTWVGTGMVAWVPPSLVYISVTGASVAMSGVVDSIQLTTVNGTDVFNGGQVNIQYE